MDAYASFYESLQIQEKHLIRAGTLLLPSVVVNVRDDSVTEDDLGLASPGVYQGASRWKPYYPGALSDLSGPGGREHLNSANVKKGTSSSAKGSSPTIGQKRKRTGSSVKDGPSSPPSPKQASARSPHVNVPVPTTQELDHLVSYAFARIEYMTLPSSESSTSHSQALLRIYVVALDTPGLNNRIKQRKLKIRSNKAKIFAQKTLSKLFHYLRLDSEEWDSGVPKASARMLLDRSSSPLALLDVYNTLEDPSPRQLDGISAATNSVLDDILAEDAPEGMYSRLYDFQKTCLWTLVAREYAPRRQVDLSYRPFNAVNAGARLYYLDANSFAWNTAPEYVEPKSAIISEGMGTGKTCICLALIMTTKHELAKLDQDSTTAGSITSVRTSRHEAFPWIEDAEHDPYGARVPPALSTVAAQSVSDNTWTIRSVPSLVDLTLDVLHCSHHAKQLSLDPQLHVSTSADLPYLWEIPASKGRDDTRSAGLQRKKVYISAATLVIVPDILVAQWLDEIRKHVKEGALDYIKLEKGDTVPAEEELSKLDLVLVSEGKVRAEEGRFWSQPATFCRCPYFKSTRMVDCRCKKVVDKGISPLVCVYWKRLIVDEGHKIAGHSDLVRLCMRLRTESRYVVSGTPSKNLVGIHDVGEAAHDEGTASAEGDKSDFERLANISAFMGLEPFCSENNNLLFMKAFHEPYRTRGDVSGIKAFLARTMVRHRVPDIALPPLTRRVVTLEFNPMERLTYNTLLALFASNSVLSERQDEDYFFHPKQKGPLNTLVSNLGAAHLFFSSPELIKSIVHAMDANRKAFDNNKAKEDRKKWSQADFQLLQAAQEHFTRALGHAIWRHSQTGSMVYSVSGISKELGDAWSGLTIAESHGVMPTAASPGSLYMTGEKVTQLRYQIGRQAAEGKNWLVESGEDFDEDLITFAHKEAQRLHEEQMERERPKVRGEAKKKSKKEVSDKPSARKAATGAFRKGTGIERKDCNFTDLPMSSGLPFANMPAMSSSKVAYVVHSILENPEEKFLVFSGGSSSSAQVSSNNLFYLAEALDLANIPHLIFVRSLSQEKLAGYAKAFSESSVFRVLLLDLKFAGRGLTLSKATRIIFTEPVWHRDEEAQAVKRAHRLGQDRPVQVETLVMKDSFEERVMRRSAQLSRRETGNAKSPHEDTQLYHALQSMQFLPDPGPQAHVRGSITRLYKPLPLIPGALDEGSAAEIEAVLHQIRQDTAAELRELSSSASRAGSVAGSSAPPRSRSITPALSHAASSEDLSDNVAVAPGSPLKQVVSKAVLMSARPDDNETDDDEVVVVSSRPAAKRPRVMFAE